MNIVYGGEIVKNTDWLLSDVLVNSLVVIVNSGTVNIKASDDEFNTTLHDDDYTADELVSLSINAKHWKMTGDGEFYVGDLAALVTPEHPYKFEKIVNSTDRSTIGGTNYSVIHNTQRKGFLNWKGVSAAEVAVFTTWFEGSNYFRDAFIAQDILNDDFILCTSNDDFPFQLDLYQLYSGSMELVECK